MLCNIPTIWEAAAAAAQKWAENKVLLSENVQLKIIFELFFGALIYGLLGTPTLYVLKHFRKGVFLNAMIFRKY